jgi:hypothetical protein
VERRVVTDLPRLTPHQRSVYDRALKLAACPGGPTGLVAVKRTYHSATMRLWGLRRIYAIGSAGALARLALKGYLRQISDDRDAVYVVVPPPTTKETP